MIGKNCLMYEFTEGNWINCAEKHSVLHEDKRWIGGSSTVKKGRVFASRRLKRKKRSPQSAKTSPFRAWKSNRSTMYAFNILVSDGEPIGTRVQTERLRGQRGCARSRSTL